MLTNRNSTIPLMLHSASRLRLFGPVWVLLASGCISNHYQVEITPDGQTLQRRMVCWREDSQDQQQKVGGIAQAELDRIALTYGVQTPTSAPRKFEFLGTFEHNTPNDIGGSGSLTQWETSLGRTSAYAERFRGRDDLSAGLDMRRAAADELVDVMTAWFQAELGEGQPFTRVRTFFDGTLRQDLRNIGVYAWTSTVVEDVTTSDTYSFEMLVRVGQYFIERGYLTTDDVPELLRLVETSDQARATVFLRRVLLAKLGLPKSETGWDFLIDPDRVRQSLNERLQQAPQYLKFCREQEPHNRPTPAEYVGDLCLRVVGLELFAGADVLEVTVRSPVAPFRTNGMWSPEEKAVVWNRKVPEFGQNPAGGLPSLVFAFWSMPDVKFQHEHFGKVILQDEPLARYCMWRKGLNEQEATEWDSYVANLKPGETLAEELQKFRFSTDTPPSADNENPPSLADAARELILPGLSDH